MMDIFSTHQLHPDVMRDLCALGDLRVASAPTPSAIDAESVGAEIIVVRAPIAPHIITREENLRACVRHGAGLDMVPVDVATQAGVLVTNVPGANASTVAEHAIWTALALLRNYPSASRALRETGWEAGRKFTEQSHDLSGRTLGMLGAGNIGKATAHIAGAGFGMTVIAHTRSPGNLPQGITPVSFERLLEEADVLLLCCPLTDATRGVIDAAALGRMKAGAVVINVARGPIIVEAALVDALTSGHLGGAALDVFDNQPLPQDHPFFSLPNVILTPHMAGITQESMLRMGQGVVQSVREIIAGEMPTTLVNPEALAAYQARF